MFHSASVDNLSRRNLREFAASWLDAVVQALVKVLGDEEKQGPLNCHLCPFDG